MAALWQNQGGGIVSMESVMVYGAMARPKAYFLPNFCQQHTRNALLNFFSSNISPLIKEWPQCMGTPEDRWEKNTILIVQSPFKGWSAGVAAMNRNSGQHFPRCPLWGQPCAAVKVITKSGANGWLQGVGTQNNFNGSEHTCPS